jgi:ABC-type Fe3+/spermidine/putrescine transport system ATPase subunit
MSSGFISLDRLTKRFGATAAVAELSLAVAKGESVTLLGPSGCGKTTTLRMVAGLETADAGRIEIDGVVVYDAASGVNLPPERRNIGMVFQSYAIWPHMTVAQNVGFPLAVRRVSSVEIGERVRKALATVGLSGFGDRPATQLSGGQQQRVALARALIHEPAVLLLDEPLSNLDVKLREQMRMELKLLQNRLGLTFINVTHDQVEALSVSDRIAIMNNGRIEQVGSPRDLYERPNTPFVRDFLGKSATLPGRVRQVANGTVGIELACHPGALLECAVTSEIQVVSGGPVEVSVRPEALRLKDREQPGDRTLKGIVTTVLYQGERSECMVRLGEDSIVIYLPSERNIAPGSEIELAVAASALRVWAK